MNLALRTDPLQIVIGVICEVDVKSPSYINPLLSTYNCTQVPIQSKNSNKLFLEREREILFIGASGYYGYTLHILNSSRFVKAENYRKVLALKFTVNYNAKISRRINSIQSSMKKNIISSLPTHNVELCSALHSMQKDGKFCDVFLHCGGKTFSAHSNVLAAQSQYFKEICEAKLKCPRNDTLDIDVNVEPHAMEIVLDFLYTGKAEFIQEHTVNVMKAAHILNLKMIYNCCQATLLETITPTNYFSLWILADNFQDETFCESIVEYAVQNFSEISEEKDFLALSLSQMKLLLGHCDVIITSQDKILEAIVLWVKNNKSERKTFLSSLLTFVQFERLSKSYLQVLVEEEAIVWESSELMRHVTKTMCTRYLHGGDSSETNPTDSAGTSIASNEETEAAIAVFGENEEKQVIFQYYSIAHDEWCPPEELPLKISNMAVVEHNGLVYLIGGKQNGNYLRTVYAYHVVNSKLRESSTLRQARSHAGVAELLGKIYVVGGYNETGFLKSVECFDPIKEEWREVAPLTNARGGVAVASLNRKLYAIGGRAGNSMIPCSTVECFDVAADQWTQITPMLYGRSHCGISVLERRLYVTGGYAKDDDVTEGCMQSYNPINKLWQALPAPSIDDWITSTVAYRNHLYVMTDGGQILRFNPETNLWTDRSLFPTIAGYYIAAVIVHKAVWDT
uniref:Kelch-like protein diablo n=1 Tax=Strigamia maritima TaxID=126957 RepID=T1IKJ3_STRMM